MAKSQDSTLWGKFITKPLKQKMAEYFSGDDRLLSPLVLLLLCVSLAGCNGNGAIPESPMAKPSITVLPTNTQGTATQSGFITSPVFVDEIDIRIVEFSPLQVHVEVKGNLATPCSEISHTEQEIGPDNLIMFTIFSKQKTDSACVQVLEPFEESFALNVSGLSAGTYQVSVNGIVGEFVLAVDNGTD